MRESLSTASSENLKFRAMTVTIVLVVGVPAERKTPFGEYSYRAGAMGKQDAHLSEYSSPQELYVQDNKLQENGSVKGLALHTFSVSCGRYRNRTCYLLDVNETLYQVS